MTRRLIVAITGASGAVYGVRLLQLLREVPGMRTHLVVTPAGWMNIEHEMSLPRRDVEALADTVHAVRDVGASIASGSFQTDGMVVAPCSMRSVSEIAYGNTTGLLTRAADVQLKERRRVVLLAREAPLHVGHLRALTQAAEIGAVILPPVPAFYARPKTIEDLVAHTVGRALDLFDIESGLVKRWGETPSV